MHIAFGFDIFYPETNGVITATVNLAKNLIEQGNEVWFFVPKDKGFKETTIENGINIVRVKAVQSWIYKGIKLLPIQGWYLQHYLSNYKIDIVHNTSPWLMGMALNHAARRLHIPTIATHHTLIDNPIYIKYALKSESLSKAAQNAIWTIIFNPFFRLTWMITAPNLNTCAQVKARNPKTDVRYVSNGIDIDKFLIEEPLCPYTTAIPSEFINRNTFVFIGRLGFEKAVDVIIDGFATIKDSNPKAKLLIIGEGPSHEQLKEMIKNNQLENRIYLTGKIPNNEIINSRLLTKVCAFVTASLSENQAMTVIEALCSGCPIICADIDNMTTLVSSEQGWYFKPSDAKDLGAKFVQALTNPQERDIKAVNARKSINKFDGREVAKEFTKIYEDLLKMKEEDFFVPGGEFKANRYLKRLRK